MTWRRPRASGRRKALRTAQRRAGLLQMAPSTAACAPSGMTTRGARLQHRSHRTHRSRCLRGARAPPTGESRCASARQQLTAAMAPWPRSHAPPAMLPTSRERRCSARQKRATARQQSQAAPAPPTPRSRAPQATSPTSRAPPAKLPTNHAAWWRRSSRRMHALSQPPWLAEPAPRRSMSRAARAQMPTSRAPGAASPTSREAQPA